VLWPKTIYVRHLEFLKIDFGHVTVIEFQLCCCVACLISSKSDEFSSRYVYMTIFNMEADRYLGVIVGSCIGLLLHPRIHLHAANIMPMHNFYVAWFVVL